MGGNSTFLNRGEPGRWRVWFYVFKVILGASIAVLCGYVQTTLGRWHSVSCGLWQILHPRAYTSVWIAGEISKGKNESCRRDVGAGKSTHASSPTPTTAWLAARLGWVIEYTGGTAPRAGGGGVSCSLNLGPDCSENSAAGKILSLNRCWLCHQSDKFSISKEK